jgi:hypothetical protein
MTRRQRLRNLAAWTLAWPDLPALALGSALAGWQLFVTLARVAAETIAREEAAK